jgi:hypothetical protein
MSPLKLAGALVAAAAAVALGLALRDAQRLPDTPPPVAWDRAACAHCHMLVGEPGTAAQLVAKDGASVVFDDPGCLVRFIAERRPVVHKLWLHHHDEERWLEPGAAGFIAGATPMGFGWVTVDRAVAGAMPWTDVQARILADPRGTP